MKVILQEGRRAGETVDMPFANAKDLIDQGRALPAAGYSHPIPARPGLGGTETETDEPKTPRRKR